ncbi:MAG: prephenate dehydrogenase/arogenate dehydrogenase family protein [Acidimicrobiales bacterium]|nr:prephenate dehydrogenase/arogenate dehydrogenase family protein [Acidimicrobiales bacterium]
MTFGHLQLVMNEASDPHRPRAQIVGTGLIGGSIGLALRAQGWHVTGRDRDPTAANRARELGALDAVGNDPNAELTFIATPVGAVASEVERALETTTGLVTDVGSVKAPMVPLMSNPRFVGGHPMAGSELEGVEGARADLFDGHAWVLTPVEGTHNEAFARIRTVVSSFGAEVVSIPPDRHDEMVAVVSHVPHLTAATLMRLADESAVEHLALLRLAAGGFRDMTRVAAGHPGIWPDICGENREAIVTQLSRLIEALSEIREIVAADDRHTLVKLLEAARAARLNLPTRFARPDELAEVRIPVRDRPGELARITTLATDLGVSIADIEIAHSAEGEEGVVILLVEQALAERFQGGLMANGYRPTLRTLE